MLQVGVGFCAFDLLIMACLNRSLQLLVGFCTLLDARNFLAAAPLLRLQLDTVLRLYAASLVNEVDDIAMEIMRGKAVKDLKDRTGKQMTDGYLVGQLKVVQPWVEQVYKHTSGYVHLSDKHMFNAMGPAAEAGMINMKVSAQDEFVPEGTYLEAIGAFRHETDLLFGFVADWIADKQAHASSTGK